MEGLFVLMKILFLIAIFIVLICILFEQFTRAKKDGLDKLGIIGLSLSIIGIVIVLISSLFI